MSIDFFIQKFIEQTSIFNYFEKWFEQNSKFDDLNEYGFLNLSATKEEYFSILVFVCVAVFLSFLLIILSYFLVVQQPETEKLSTYECGFEPYEDARNKFNVRFYIIAILFILFDIEIIFLLPWCVSVSQLNLMGFWSMIEFLLELSIGFVYVWCVGAIEWS